MQSLWTALSELKIVHTSGLRAKERQQQATGGWHPVLEITSVVSPVEAPAKHQPQCFCAIVCVWVDNKHWHKRKGTEDEEKERWSAKTPRAKSVRRMKGGTKWPDQWLPPWLLLLLLSLLKIESSGVCCGGRADLTGRARGSSRSAVRAGLVWWTKRRRDV